MAARRGGPAAALLVAAAFVGVIALVRGRCTPPYVSCGGVWTRIDTVESCGACGVRCAAVHAEAACVAGRCTLACEPGFADCDGHPGNGCEADLASNRMHCGSCIKTCGGARCERGVCAAQQVAAGSGITALAADDRAVYAIGAVVTKYPLDGSDPVPVGPDDVPGSEKAMPSGGRGHLQWSDGADVFWAEPSGEGSVIRRISTGGGEPAAVAMHPRRISALTGNKTHLFWADDKHRIFTAPKKPGEGAPPPLR